MRPGSCDRFPRPPRHRRVDDRSRSPAGPLTPHAGDRILRFMSSAEIRITAEPIDNARCKFLVSEPVHDGGVRRFASPDDANGSPLVEAIFAIPGAEVAEVIVSGNLVTVVKRSAARSEERRVGKEWRGGWAGEGEQEREVKDAG